MSTEIAPRPAGSLDEKKSYAVALAQSGLLPDAYRQQPANVLLAMELGEALRIPPIQAINGVNVIKGKPSMSADLMAAVIRRAGHKLRVTETHQPLAVTAELIRADDPDFTFRAVWDEEKARTAGLWGKGNWSTYPMQMLRARAVSEVARQGASDALMGVIYVPEELGATDNTEGWPTPAGEPEQSADDLADVTDAEVIEDEAPAVPLASDAQRRKLFALFTQKGVTEEQQRKGLGKYMGLPGPVESRSEATAAAAARFIEWLETQPDAEVEPEVHDDSAAQEALEVAGGTQ